LFDVQLADYLPAGASRLFRVPQEEAATITLQSLHEVRQEAKRDILKGVRKTSNKKHNGELPSIEVTSASKPDGMPVGTRVEHPLT
jgi:hypothetical protein